MPYRISTSFKVMAVAGCLVAVHPVGAFEANIDITGDEDVADALRNASRTLAAQNEDTTEPLDILAAAQADYRQILAALYRQGYYGGVVNIAVDGREAANIAPLNVPARIDNVRITVQTGPRFTFGRTAIAPLAPDTELPDTFASGEIARAGAVADASDAAIDQWRAASHAKAAVRDQRIIATHPQQRLDVDITLAPGPAVRFGRFIPQGNVAVRTDRIHEIAGLPEGEAYSPADVEAAAARLRRAGAFRSVAISEADTLGPGNTLDITAALVEEAPRRFGFGAEIESLEGGTVSAYWMHRNLLGGSERLRFDGEIAGIGSETSGMDYRVAARFTRPATFWTDTSAYLNAEIAVLDEPDFYSRNVNLGGGLEAIFSDTFSASGGIAFRYSVVEDDLGERSFTHLTLPFSATWDRRDDLLNPTSGYYLAGEAMPFIGLSGSASGARITADARGYFGLGAESRFVLAGRVQLGSVMGASLAETPPDLLFRSGGGGTVRGQPYQSLNVDLGGGLSTGGRGFVATSAELRAGITERIGLVGFVDAGWIDAASLPDGSSPMHAGAGLGLRYNTGIGPIRLDVATPIAGDTGGGVQFYVGIGQAF